MQHYDTLPATRGHMGDVVGEVEDYDIPIPAQRGTLPGQGDGGQYLYPSYNSSQEDSGVYDTPNPAIIGSPPTESPLPPPPSTEEVEAAGESIYDVPRH